MTTAHSDYLSLWRDAKSRYGDTTVPLQGHATGKIRLPVSRQAFADTIFFAVSVHFAGIGGAQLR
jgi:hypothetical protein